MNLLVQFPWYLYALGDPRGILQSKELKKQICPNGGGPIPIGI